MLSYLEELINLWGSLMKTRKIKRKYVSGDVREYEVFWG